MFFAIGIENNKTPANLGTLWRTAELFGASYIFTIGRRYRPQITDTMKSFKNLPLFSYDNIDEFYANMPYNCLLVGVELHEKSQPIKEFYHPARCVYLLGAEDNGLSKNAISRCHKLIQLPGKCSMNVAVCGSIVMYDRITKFP